MLEGPHLCFITSSFLVLVSHYMLDYCQYQMNHWKNGLIFYICGYESFICSEFKSTHNISKV